MLGKSKVSYLQGHLRGASYKQVLWLQIKVGHVVSPHVLKGRGELAKKIATGGFRQRMVFLNIRGQVARAAEFHEDVDVPEIHNEWV